MYNHNHTPTTKFDFLPAIQKSDERQQLANAINVITDSLYLTNNNDSSVQFLRYISVCLGSLASDATAIPVLDIA